MQALYKPIGIFVGILSGLIARRTFAQIWDRLDGDENGPPKPEAPDATFRRIVAAAALQGAVVALVRATVKRGGATAWWNLTGTWPGKRTDEA